MQLPFQVRPLTKFSDFVMFECRVPSVNAFIHKGLSDALVENQCETYGVYDGNTLVAFFALKEDNSFVDYQGAKSALEIAFLAVDKKYELQGIGRSIIQEISRIALSKDSNYYRYLTVEALVITQPKKEAYEAVSFYRKCHFTQAELFDPAKDTLSMYLQLR